MRLIEREGLAMAAGKLNLHSYPLETIEKAINLIASSPVDYIETEEINDASVASFAGQTTPGRLDWGDLFMALIYEQVTSEGNEISAEQKALRRALGFPPVDPEGVKLIFAVTIQPNHIIAQVKIIPTASDERPNEKVDIFIGGIYHPASVYFPGATQFAIKERRTLVLVDSIGVGSGAVAKGETLDYELLAGEMGRVIEDKYAGKIRYLMGHSLGSIPVRHLYIEYREHGGRRLADKYIPITMVPAAGEERAGLVMNPQFSTASLPFVLAGEMRPVSDGIFFGGHPAAERKKLLEVIHRQRCSVNMFGFMGVLNEVSARSLLPYIGDEDLIVVFSTGDGLMQLHNKEEWEKRGVLFLDGDHSCMAGDDYAVRCWTQLSDLLSNRNDLEEGRVDEVGIQTRFKPEVAFIMKLKGNRLASDGRDILGYAGLGMDLDMSFGHYIDWSMLGADALIGDINEISVPFMLSTELRLTPRNSRASFLTGVEAGYDLPNEAAVVPYIYTGISYNSFNILRVVLTGGATVFADGMQPTCQAALEILL